MSEEMPKSRFQVETEKHWADKEDEARLENTALDVAEAKLRKQDEKDDSDARYGKINYETQVDPEDFERLNKVFIPDLSAFNGEFILEVVRHIYETYADKYYVPGFKYWKWASARENQDKVPADLKDGNNYFFPSSKLMSGFGSWGVPCVSWTRIDDSAGSPHHWFFSTSESFDTKVWNSSCRVALFEK